MKRQSLKVIGILLLVFSLGFLTGIATHDPLVNKNPEGDELADEPVHKLNYFLKKKLTKDLELTPEQEERVNAELEAMAHDLTEAKQEFKPVLQKIIDSTYARIENELNDEQWAQFEENRRRMKEWLSKDKGDKKHHRRHRHHDSDRRGERDDWKPDRDDDDEYRDEPNRDSPRR